MIRIAPCIRLFGWLLLIEDVGCQSAQGCMRSNGIIVERVVVDAGDHLLRCGVLFDINVIIFQAAEKSLRTNII